MRDQDLLGKIIEYLEVESETSRFVNISPEVYRDFTNVGRNRSLKSSNGEGVVYKTDTINAPVINEKKSGYEENRKNEPQVEKTDLSAMKFDGLKKAVSTCKNCRLNATRTNTVFGEGSLNAELMFIGEGPGRDEDEQGRPFVGRAGQLLTDMIIAMQFRREDVFIANIVKCRPPENRNPMDDEIEQCLPYLTRQIELINPKVLVLLGAVPLKALLGKTGITKIRGEWHEYKGIKTMPTLHPAYLLRNPPAKKEAWDDLKKVMAVFGKQPSARKKPSET